MEAMTAHAGRNTRRCGSGRRDGARDSRDDRRNGSDRLSPSLPMASNRNQASPPIRSPGMTTLAPDGVIIPFEDGAHTRQLPVLTAGPFRYTTYSGNYVRGGQGPIPACPVKQAVHRALGDLPDLSPGRNR